MGQPLEYSTSTLPQPLLDSIGRSLLKESAIISILEKALAILLVLEEQKIAKIKVVIQKKET